MECGCGRSPTGKCIGWHGLSEEQYQEKLKEHKEEDNEEEQTLFDGNWDIYIEEKGEGSAPPHR